MIGQEPIFFDKARESLIGAESEFLNERFNNRIVPPGVV